jgi:TetR/AcrR family transcriptional repressor of nem operon
MKAAKITETSPRVSRQVRAVNRTNTRELLIRAGTALMSERSYAATGVEEILKQAGVPRGSFYHFFSSKEAFGEAVIENYANYFNRKLDRLLFDPSMSPMERLRAYVEEAKRGMERFQFTRGCLIGNLSQELGAHNEAFRPKLEEVFKGWERRIATCLRQAAALGEVAPDIDADALAEFFWTGWEGALLRAKLTRNVEPIEKFATQYFKMLKQ